MKEHTESPELGCKIGRAYQILLNRLATSLNKAGIDLTTSEYLVLRAIFKKPGVQQCEIADMVGKDKAAVCRCVVALDKKGFVKLQSVSHKCLKVFPSDSALELEPKIMEVAAKRHKALTELTSADELDVFERILDKIINSK